MIFHFWVNYPFESIYTPIIAWNGTKMACHFLYFDTYHKIDTEFAPADNQESKVNMQFCSDHNMSLINCTRGRFYSKIIHHPQFPLNPVQLGFHISCASSKVSNNSSGSVQLIFSWHLMAYISGQNLYPVVMFYCFNHLLSKGRSK